MSSFGNHVYVKFTEHMNMTIRFIFFKTLLMSLLDITVFEIL